MSGTGRRKALANFEGHYASGFYSQLAALGLNVQPEDITHKGRIEFSKAERNVVGFDTQIAIA
jgi:hypothetical protein